jgi:hypothetical protein
VVKNHFRRHREEVGILYATYVRIRWCAFFLWGMWGDDSTSWATDGCCESCLKVMLHYQGQGDECCIT